MLDFSGHLQCGSLGRIPTVEQSAVINQHRHVAEHRGQRAPYLYHSIEANLRYSPPRTIISCPVLCDHDQKRSLQEVKSGVVVVRISLCNRIQRRGFLRENVVLHEVDNTESLFTVFLV